MNDVDVLIAGAGPTGLVLALCLARAGVRVRIVDKAPAVASTSRALVVHARTLEFYRQLGIADAVVDASVRFDALNLWVGGRHVAHVELGALGAGATAYPYVLIFPQDEHERLLGEQLAAAGVTVERPCALARFDDRGDGVVARLMHDDGREETCSAAYLAGCDGAHSTVREQLGAGFPGATYAHLFYVADVEAQGPAINGELNVALDFADLVAIFPMKGDGRVRFIGTVKPENEQAEHALEWNDVSRRAIDTLRIDVTRVNWFSTYHVHHRVASHFRSGRTFLLGDAAHIHSPVGGQGMNTGIGDAINLGWKIAGALRRTIDSRVLESFEPERLAFAKRLVATTDRAFKIATSDGPIARFVRLHAIPEVLPPLTALSEVRRFMFRTLSQTAIEYRDSALSRGVAGSVHAGDRLPWVDLREDGAEPIDNYAPLAAREFQVHVYGGAKPALCALCGTRGIALHAFAWREAMAAAGFARDACYLLRPDGYVAFAERNGDDTSAFTRYLDDWRITARS
ncbi:MAG TPA: FAD-dependent monooxygenase [Casimicrobiaceae bacterium]|jgi:2-polyprenyl-6-methoxyphenol hydroxylase-like FAD-dependent oxidoreductase|nr:FAD-dependent monooxygenase [Casimicrobiaceae bacterium]